MANDNQAQGTANRRRFIKGVGGTVTAGFIAGCSGNGGGEGTTTSGGGEGTTTSGGGEGTAASGSMDFPKQPITFIIPYGPGGGYDFYTRTLAKVLTEESIVPVQVNAKNVAGAGGITATNQVYKAKPDGYTNMIMNTESFALAQIARPNAVRYKLNEMTALPRVAGTLRAIAVSSDSDIKSFQDLNQRTKNGEVNWGNQGPTTTSAVMIKSLAELGGSATFSLKDYRNHSVQFGGRGEEFTALKRGDVSVMSGSYSSLREYVASGDLRFVLVYNKKQQCPSFTKNQQCTTLASTKVNVKNVDQIIAFAGGPFHRVFAGPPGMPENIHNYLCSKITEAIQSDRFKQLCKEADRPIKYGKCELADKGIKQTYNTYANNKGLLEKMGLLQNVS